MVATLEQLGIDQLSPSDRIELIGKIWDSIDSNDVSSIPPWHLDELDRRMDAADANQEVGTPWEIIKARLERKP